MKLSVIIPAYNEAKTLAEIIRRVQVAEKDQEIIVVDDGSTDGSGAMAQSLGAQVITLADGPRGPARRPATGEARRRWPMRS